MDFTEYRYYSKNKPDFYFALFSDLHADSSTFQRAAFKRDADKYAALGARFLFNGDLFDAILPSDRKRYTRGNDAFTEDAQINQRIKFVYDLLLPYVDLIDFIGIGNHEASIVKYSGADLVAFLVRDLNLARDKKLPPIQRGGYQGFLRLIFSDSPKLNEHIRIYDIYREHGKGGAAPVTKGTINIQRLHTTYLADLYWLGHSHTDITDKTAWTVYPDRSGKIVRKRKRSVITAGYQGSFEQRNLTEGEYYRNGFPEEKFLIPSGEGSALLHIRVPSKNGAPLEPELTN
jgi:hypothetical protein